MTDLKTIDAVAPEPQVDEKAKTVTPESAPMTQPAEAAPEAAPAKQV